MSNSVETLNGLYKERYADKVQQLVPDHVKLYNAVKFDTAKKQGKSYVEPVILSYESGFSYGGTGGSLFALNEAKEFQMEEASVLASELVLRSAISIGALNRSASSGQAISKAMDLMVGNMLSSIYHRLEVQMFYGQSGLGSLKTADTTGAATKVLEINDAEWAAGIWNGTTGAAIEIFNSSVSSLKLDAVEIAGYSLTDKTVTIVRSNGLDFVTSTHDVAVDDVIFFKGAATTTTKNEFIGIHEISEEIVSLFGIANADKPLFQGSVVNVGASAGAPAALSQAKIEQGISAMVEKGLMQEEVSVYVNPKQWDDLLSEQDAKRTIDQSYNSGKHQSGAREIEFFGQNGTIKIKASTFVKQGYSYIVCEKELKRIGSTEVTFDRPDGGEFAKLLEAQHGIEMRCMTDESLFTARPSSICQLRYILAE